MVDSKYKNVWLDRWEESALELQQKCRQNHQRKSINEKFNNDSWQDCLEKADKNRIDDPKDWVSDDEEEYCHIADIEQLHTDDEENKENCSSTGRSKPNNQHGRKSVSRNKIEVFDLCIVGDNIHMGKNISRCDQYINVKSNIVGNQNCTHYSQFERQDQKRADKYHHDSFIYTYNHLSKRRQIVNEKKMKIILDILAQMNHELSKILSSKKGQPVLEANQTRTSGLE